LDGRDALSPGAQHEAVKSNSYDSSLIKVIKGAVNNSRDYIGQKSNGSTNDSTPSSWAHTMESTIETTPTKDGDSNKDARNNHLPKSISSKGTKETKDLSRAGTGTVTSDGSVASKVKSIIKNSILSNNPLWGAAKAANQCYFPPGGREAGIEVLGKESLNNSNHTSMAPSHQQYYNNGVGIGFGMPTAAAAGGGMMIDDNPNWRDMVTDNVETDRPMNRNRSSNTDILTQPQQQQQQQQQSQIQGPHPPQVNYHQGASYANPGRQIMSPSSHSQGHNFQNNQAPMQLSYGAMNAPTNSTMNSHMDGHQGRYQSNDDDSGLWQSMPANTPMMGGQKEQQHQHQQHLRQELQQHLPTPSPRLPTINSNLSEESTGLIQDKYAGMELQQKHEQPPQPPQQQQRQMAGQEQTATNGAYHPVMNGYNNSNVVNDTMMRQQQGMRTNTNMIGGGDGNIGGGFNGRSVSNSPAGGRTQVSSPAMMMLLDDDTLTNFGPEDRYSDSQNLSPRSVSLNAYENNGNNAQQHHLMNHGNRQPLQPQQPQQLHQPHQPQQRQNFFPGRQSQREQQQQHQGGSTQTGHQQQHHQQVFGQSNHGQTQTQHVMHGDYNNGVGGGGVQQHRNNVHGYGMQRMQSLSQPMNHKSSHMEQQQYQQRPGPTITNGSSAITNSGYQQVDSNPNSIGYYSTSVTTANNNINNNAHLPTMSPPTSPRSPAGYRTFAA